MTDDDEIINYVTILKYNKENKDFILFRCFHAANTRDHELCAKQLIQYLIMMKGFQCKQTIDNKSPFSCQEELLDKYEELYPVAKINKKLLKRPEKYLGKDYKRVSKNIVNIYFPSLFDKLKNIFVF